MFHPPPPPTPAPFSSAELEADRGGVPQQRKVGRAVPAPLAARAPPGRQEGAVGKDRGRRDQKLYGYRRHQVVGDCEAPCEPDPEAVPRALLEPP